MSITTNAKLQAFAEKFCSEEAKAAAVYRAVAELSSNPQQKNILQELARQEEKHYRFWKSLAGRDCSSQRVWPLLIKLAYKILGPVFVLQLLERSEEKAVTEYNEVLKLIEDPRLEEQVRKIIKEEAEHEEELLRQVEDARVKYMGFIALGLADAIVEITGVHAGFLGATSNTLMAGIAGLVVGFSAALSMAGAAYLQAKHGGGETRPSTSAFVTGISYIVSVVLLALPYFLTKIMLIAFAASLAVAISMVAGFTYYSVVVESKNFSREFLESIVLLLGTAIGSFLFGLLLGIVFGTENLSITP